MLWVYINNQGVAECKVNVGNRIRQGNGFDVFVCLEGQQNDPQTNVWRLQDIGYLKPSATEFVYVYDGNDIEETSQEFVLGDPSQVNSYFIGNKTYNGYKVHIPADATNFPSNGGHVALSFLMMDEENRGVFAQTISVYVEATQGMHPTTITADDYATLISLFRQSNVFNIGEQSSLDFLDRYAEEPQSVYFTMGSTPYLALTTYDEDTHKTTQTLIYIDEERGLLCAKYRAYDGSWGQWSEESLLDEITSLTLVSDSNNTKTYRLYTKSHPEGVGDISVSSAGFATPTATATIATLEPNTQATVAVTINASGPDTEKQFAFGFNFGIPKGEDGVITETSGFVGFQIDNTGHLIMTTSGEDSPNISVNSSGHLIYAY